MSVSNNKEERKSLKTDVLLPNDEYCVQSWKVEAGTAVRVGQTIAIACRKDSATAKPENSTATTTISSAHKRPNRRRKISPAATALPTADQNDNKSKAPSTVLTTTSLQQRLVEKLGSEKKEKSSDQQDQQKPSNSVNPIASSKNNETTPILATADGLLRVSKNPHSALGETQKKRAIAYIEECLHPGFLDGLCFVCGFSMIKEDNDNILDHHCNSADATSTNVVDPTVQVTVSGGVTMTVSEREGRQIAQQDSERLLKQRKLSLVLDLDHTLVHATSDHRARQYVNHDEVRTLRLPLWEGMPPPSQYPHTISWMQHYVKFRPNLKELLESVQPTYELTVYTAGTRQYAEEITIVLCRHLVGSRRDVEDLERLRYEVAMAAAEYAKHDSLNGCSLENGINHGDDKKRKVDELSGGTDSDENDGSGEPAKKRKKVSFGPVPYVDNETANAENLKSDHISLQQLEELRTELRDAEELEKKAWELRAKIFGSRVVSRTDVGDLGRDVKSLKRIFPCGGTMAAVVDDREDVWANAADNSDDTIKGEPPDNLLLVRPYHWSPFHGFADVNNASGVDLCGTGPGGGAGPDEETDVQLIWTKRILEELHRRYYEQNEENRRTVPEILSQMRSEVLRGSSLVLSGLVPLHKKTITANTPRPPIVRYAESLGSTVRSCFGLLVQHEVLHSDISIASRLNSFLKGCTLV